MDIPIQRTMGYIVDEAFIETLTQRITQSVLVEMQALFNANKTEEYLSRQQVADLLKVKPQTITNWTTQERLKAHLVGGKRLYPKTEVMAFLKTTNG